MLTSRRRASRLLALPAILLVIPPAAAQNRDRLEREGFFDGIHAPNLPGHGLVPEDAYTVPDDARALTQDVMAAMAEHDDDRDEGAMVQAVR